MTSRGLILVILVNVLSEDVVNTMQNLQLQAKDIS